MKPRCGAARGCLASGGMGQFSGIVANNPIQPPPTCRKLDRAAISLQSHRPGGDRAASFRHGSPALLYTGNSRDKGIAPGPLPTWKSATIARPGPIQAAVVASPHLADVGQ